MKAAKPASSAPVASAAPRHALPEEQAEEQPERERPPDPDGQDRPGGQLVVPGRHGYDDHGRQRRDGREWRRTTSMAAEPMGRDLRRPALRGGLAACAVALALPGPGQRRRPGAQLGPEQPLLRRVRAQPAGQHRPPGARPPGAGGQVGQAPARTSLPAGVRAKLRRAGSGGARLEALSTAPELGAPVGPSADRARLGRGRGLRGARRGGPRGRRRARAGRPSRPHHHRAGGSGARRPARPPALSPGRAPTTGMAVRILRPLCGCRGRSVRPRGPSSRPGSAAPRSGAGGGLPPALVLGTAAAAPFGLWRGAAPQPPARRRHLPAQMWAYVAAYEMPHDDPEALERRVQIAYPFGGPGARAREIPRAPPAAVRHARPFRVARRCWCGRTGCGSWSPTAPSPTSSCAAPEGFERRRDPTYAVFDLGLVGYWAVRRAPVVRRAPGSPRRARPSCGE